VLSLHIPWTPETNQMVDAAFVMLLRSLFGCLTPLEEICSYGRFSIGYTGKVLGAGLDVLEYEKLSLKLFSRGQYT
jgi:D-3-phosphoglycerate dehydrogenase